MLKNDTFFPIRYEKTRPFLKELNSLANGKKSAELFQTDNTMIFQNIIFDEMVKAEEKLPIGILGDEKSFNLKLARELNYYWFYYTWLKNGKNNFYFKKELLTMFEFSDVDKIPFSTIKMPFDSFYISFSDLDRMFGIDTAGTEIYIDGVMVVKNFNKDNQLDFFLNAFTKNSKKSKDWLLNKFASLYGDWFRINYNLDTDTLKNTGFIPKFLDNNANENLTEGTRIFFSQVVNLILNSICYLSSPIEKPRSAWPDGAPKNLTEKAQNGTTKRKREVAISELQNKGYTQVKIFGESYKTSNSNLETKNVASHWRRGHWRNQPFRTENETKLIWIKPTIINKEKGKPEKGKIYNVE
ncbi:hypothetical protein [Gelidibacter japonicus]|uniref:hypothetical protein n=1 Tax=Gelidibacter japonicus TaxID=1962232 RepID=UPI002AFE29C5|nr:hypothetical protein [Gelidibacter japonicus]